MNGITNKKGTAMKKLIMTIVGAIALGASAEHVNLWPLYYDDGGSKSIAWPLIEYGDSTDWRFGLVFREYDSWGVFPFFFDFSNSIVVTPVVVSKDLSGGAIFPILFADFKGSDTFWTLFPAIYRHDWGYDNATTWAAAGLVGHTVRRGETDAHWLAPLYWAKPRERFCVLAGGLAGWDHEREDKFMDWALPFYWRDEDSFWSIPWACGYGEDGKVESWFSLPLLSWCRGDELHITPIAGKTDDSSWIAPLYYWNARGTFCTLFGGKTKEASWVLPFYYKDKDAFLSLPLYYRNSEDFFTIPYARKNHTEFYLCGLAGRSRRPEETNDWLLPLWYRDDSSFCSIPYGRIDENEKTTLNWWGLPLLRTRSGECRGFGIQPIFEYKCDRRIGAIERAIDAERLPEALRKSAPETALPLDTANESLEWLLGLAGSEHSIWGGREHRENGDQVVLRENEEAGNVLLLKRRRYRTVRFDAQSGAREKVSESGSSHFLGFVWNSSWRSENGEVVSSESSVLWRVWRSKLKDGHSTLDVFPWFSRESDRNGRTATSFLWRFYRRETDPAKGTALDLLFIPVLRQ